jgi:OmpA-OmpF porin, OOP family
MDRALLDLERKMFKKFIAALVALTAAFSACAATSGATFNLQEIQIANGKKAFKVECHGLFTSGASCLKAAQEACGNQQVNALQALQGTAAADPREMIFTCGTPQQAAPAVTPAPVPVEPSPSASTPAPESRKIVLDEKANFAFDSAQLTPNARRILDKLIADSNGITFSSVSVSGFTDSVGSDQYNVRLSQRRAEAVLNYLKSHKLQSNNFSTQGLGKGNPVASNATRAGRAENRRVEIDLKQ